VGDAPGDPFEIYFLLDAPEGSRGSEGCTILCKEPMKRFSFTWNAPPHLPHVRPQHTIVELRFSEEGDSGSKLCFVHSGWGEGEEWDQAYQYFENAWFSRVIPNLKTALESS